MSTPVVYIDDSVPKKNKINVSYIFQDTQERLKNKPPNINFLRNITVQTKVSLLSSYRINIRKSYRVNLRVLRDTISFLTDEVLLTVLESTSCLRQVYTIYLTCIHYQH